MSVYSVQRYQAEIEKLIRFGGSKNEGALEQEFAKLLNEYCKPKGFILVPKIAVKTPQGKTVIPDGVIKDSLRLDWGYWESKDEKDDLDEEIAAKFKKDYPKDNILFEDHTTAVLYRGGKEMMRVPMSDAAALDKLLSEFISYEPPMVRNFRTAIEHFKADLPTVVESLRVMIDEQAKENKNFRNAQEAFWELCKQVINPEITRDDIREMLIQHILTEEIFNTIFDETQFHRENNIAKELTKVEETFFTGQTKRDSLSRVKHYYEVINATAAGIADHHEKQKFLKVIYETFYKAYNPKAADRLGSVYTPGEIVNFMIESTDYLLHKHFGKGLGEKNVEILDPATGTGTFICDIIDYLSASQLEYKYKNEIHANEVAILPYYIANLNIEFTYKQKTGRYEEFENICFVDTLDNVGFDFKGKQGDIFGSVSKENIDRIQKQNLKKISVIIGNPPYNANQENYNDFNKNREYKEIDKRIRDTYVKESSAQKTKAYDMVSRFFRWASDRIDKNGVIAFVCNSTFITKKSYDGFRKVVGKEFSDIYIIDLAGDLRDDKEGNVFGIRVGVSIIFLIKNNSNKDRCHVNYFRTPYKSSKEKLDFLSAEKMSGIDFTKIIPDTNNSWLNNSDNDFDSLVSLKGSKNNALFILTSNAVSTNRDEWVYDIESKNLIKKVKFFITTYNESIKSRKLIKTIKWSATLEDLFKRKTRIDFEPSKLVLSLYRAFTKRFLFYEKHLSDRLTANHFMMFGETLNKKNKVIIFSGGQRAPFAALSSETPPNLDIFMPNGTNCLPLYRYDDLGNRIDNITDWGLAQFREHYGVNHPPAPALKRRGSLKKIAPPFQGGVGVVDPGVISKEDIFHYVYGVLHDPKYRKKYELNLKREFPRIPFYEDFAKWAKWGKELMDLHIGYETVKPYKLPLLAKERAGVRSGQGKGKPHPNPLLSKERGLDKERGQESPKAKLKADKENGIIILDEDTSIGGIPKSAWDYKLGNRSALEWILDQYKEKTPKDPTIREKFNTYKFADYKDKVIDLIKRVTTASVRTVAIMGEMEKEIKN